MFPQFDNKFFEQLGGNPTALLSKLADFQRANFEAARKIAENNANAFQELVSQPDPQAFFSSQPAIIQSVVQQNSQILTDLWQSLGASLAPPNGKGK